MLDVGCWVGFLLDEARRSGYARVLGIEPSAFASQHARDDFGLEVITADVFAAEPSGTYDVIVLGDVIEHVPDPGALLERLKSWLAPGGLVCLMLPDAGSRTARLLVRRWWSIIPTHVQYFTRASIAALLLRHGLRVVRITTQPKAFTAGYYLERLAVYLPPLRVFNRGRLAARIVTPDLRDRMLVLATRA